MGFNLEKEKREAMEAGNRALYSLREAQDPYVSWTGKCNDRFDRRSWKSMCICICRRNAGSLPDFDRSVRRLYAF